MQRLPQNLELKTMPMNRKLYPKNWDAIAYVVKEKANWTCEECGRPCRRIGESWAVFCAELLEHGSLHPWYIQTREIIHDEEMGETTVEKPGRFVLSVAHLDQNPGNNAPENLRALCSVCHLRYDAKPHAVSRKRNRRRRQEEGGQLSLW
jgi:5-methylcytosine-specific restriction endonuclease McrA